jgi:MFS transporter, DHA1 family, multidrug resistance protein
MDGLADTADWVADLFFVSYPISFIEQRGWSLGIGGLPFLAVMMGVVIGGVINFVFIRTRYVRILKRDGRVPPEERLVPMMVGSVALPIGLFWYAWTSSPGVFPIAQIMSGVPVGVGLYFDIREIRSLKLSLTVRRHRPHLPSRHKLYH